MRSINRGRRSGITLVDHFIHHPCTPTSYLGDRSILSYLAPGGAQSQCRLGRRIKALQVCSKMDLVSTSPTVYFRRASARAEQYALDQSAPRPHYPCGHCHSVVRARGGKRYAFLLRKILPPSFSLTAVTISHCYKGRDRRRFHPLHPLRHVKPRGYFPEPGP